MRIVNPTFGTALATAEAVTEGKVDWMNDPIIMFSNNKPNARELFEGMRERLGTIRRIDNVDFISKPSASRPRPRLSTTSRASIASRWLAWATEGLAHRGVSTTALNYGNAGWSRW